jgi:hypothetical protein
MSTTIVALIDASLAARLLVVRHDADPLARAMTHDVLLDLSCPTIVVQEPASAAP